MGQIFKASIDFMLTTTGAMGVLIGAGSGIMRSAPPTLFAIVAGIQWFALGSSYMGMSLARHSM